MTRFGPPLVTAHSVVGGPSSPQLRPSLASDVESPGPFDHSHHDFPSPPPPPHAPTSTSSQYEMLSAKTFSPLAAAMTQQLHEFNGVAPSDFGASSGRRLSLNQLQSLNQSGFAASMAASLPHPHLAPSASANPSAAAYAALLDDFDRQRNNNAELPAMYTQRLWMQRREVNIVFGRDVIQVPLKVEHSDNEYVNLVLSQREFDIMAVHVSKYDEMHPTELLDEITRVLKEKQKNRRNAYPLSNQLGEFPDSNTTFQARIRELEYELSRLNTKLTAARAVQTTLTDENTLLRSKMQELEQRCMENETLKMQNDVLRDQSVMAFAQNTKLKKMLTATTQELKGLSSQMQSLRTQVHFEKSEIATQVEDSMNALIANVRDREHVLQESYLAEKKERQLIAEKYYEISGRIRVFCRLRPVTRRLDMPTSTALLRPKPNSLLVDRSGKEFTFDQVFGPENSQSDVYAQMEPVVISFVDGYNACIMAYGQTGSGKTFTMTGGSGEFQGMIPRALQQVFSVVNARQLTFKDTLSVSMVEIYNDQILDLLTDGESGVKIKNENEITLRPVTLWEHVNAVLAEGNANRNVAATSMNVESSRSHALVFLNLESQHRETMEIRKSTLCLVDLAGSERISRSQVEGDRLKETQHINKSLSALGDVMHALQHRAKHVPYRNSKLTYMLREMLSGQAKTLMMLQLSPEDDDIEETICSLQFGARVSQIQMGAVKTSIESGEIFKLKDQNRTLERKIAQLEEQASVWKQENRSTQVELREARDRNQQLQAELGQQQDDMTLLQEKFEAAAVASQSSVSPPVSPQKSDASAKSARSVTSTSSAPAATPAPSRYGATAASTAARPARSSGIAGTTTSRLASTTRPSPRSVPKEPITTTTTAPTAAERVARRKSLTTLNSPTAATVLSARERLARAAKEPAAQANRRATLGAIGTSSSQPNLSASSTPTSRTRVAASSPSASPVPTTNSPARPAPTRRINSLSTPKTVASPSRTAAISAALRAPPTALEKRRSLASSRSTPSTPVTGSSTTRSRLTAPTASSGARAETTRRTSSPFAV